MASRETKAPLNRGPGGRHRNRLEQIIEDAGGSDPNTADTNTFMEYNGAVQTKLKDHDNNATTYGYDAALRLTSIQYPDHTGGSPGNSTYGVVSYEYWPGGMLKKRTAQDGIEASYAYNDLHQHTSRSSATPSIPTALAHASSTGEQRRTLDKRSNWTTFVETLGTTTRSRVVADGANEYGQFTINSTDVQCTGIWATSNIAQLDYSFTPRP